MNILTGFLITSLLHVSAVQDHSTAVAFFVQDTQSVTQYLDEIDNNLVPIVFIDHIFIRDGKYIYQDTTPLKNALRKSSHFGRIILGFDEPCHKGRQNAQECPEILNVMNRIKMDFRGVEFMHIEAGREIYLQSQENNGWLHLWYGADHIGFNCYSPIDKCGGNDIPYISHDAYIKYIHYQILAHGSDAKIFLVPGSFINTNYMTSQHDVITQMNDYTELAMKHDSIISGMGYFLWGNLLIPGDMSYGAIGHPLIAESAFYNLKKVARNRDMSRRLW